jgi:acyl-CoA dehydrogenase
MTERANVFDADPVLQGILKRQWGPTAYAKATPRLRKMGDAVGNEADLWSDLADHQGPRLVTHDRNGERIDEILYHPAYRELQKVAYGGGIVAASYDPTLAAERGNRPKALTFSLGYLFGQTECGLYCPVCMTDGAARLVQQFGGPELGQRFIPRLASMDMASLYTGAMFLTEREGGSDVGQVRTVAKGSGPTVRLFGNKWFCSNVDADVIMILARPEGAPAGTKGLGLYLLPRTLENGKRNAYRIDRIKDKLGVRSMPTGEVTLEGAEAYLLGGPGQGFVQMAEMLNLSRLYNGVASVSVLRRSLTEALSWAQSRVTFGRRLLEHPLMSETLLDLAAVQRGALRWAFRGIELLDKADGGEASETEKQTLRLLTPLLKYSLAKSAVASASEAMEVLGGNGYIEDWPMARVLRDAQVLPIWEGSTNILVLDAFRALRKGSHEAFFAELEALTADADLSVRARLSSLGEELLQAVGAMASDAGAEHVLRDWTDRAGLLWQVGLLASKKAGAGSDADVRAARRLLARGAPGSLLRSDRATPDDVVQVALS